MVIHNDRSRAEAIAIIRAAPDGSRVEIKGPQRTTEQNKLMWSVLTNVALQVKWCDRILRPNDWKILFMDALENDTDIVSSLDGRRVVSLGHQSSDLSKEEMANLIDSIFAWGADKGVRFSDPVP